jgi:hypothetical protein
MWLFYCYAECRYAECYNAECRYAECCNAECRYAECCNAECRYAECRIMEVLVKGMTQYS